MGATGLQMEVILQLLSAWITSPTWQWSLSSRGALETGTTSLGMVSRAAVLPKPVNRMLSPENSLKGHIAMQAIQ